MTNSTLTNKLNQIEQEHRDLDEILIQIQENQTVDFLKIKRC